MKKMNEIITILFEEEKRLSGLVEHSSKRLSEAEAPAVEQREQPNHLTGENVMVSYLNLDKFTEAQLADFRVSCQKHDEHNARLYVFKDFINQAVQQVIYPTKYPSQGLEDFKKIEIPCNQIELDDNGNFAKYSIKVGPLMVPSSSKMPFDEYRSLYQKNLYIMLSNMLDNSLSQEEKDEQIKQACADFANQLKQNAKQFISL